MRATVGKCMMDSTADHAPVRLRERTRQSIHASVDPRRRWHGAA